MLISKTPFRVSFFGGGTDYPTWYKKHKGAVLATTIDKYCYITCRYLPPFFDYKHRIVYSKTELAKSLNEIQHVSVRESLKFMGIKQGVEIHHDGDLPARTGLGSSSSFTVGLLHALYALKGIMPSKMQLATEAIHIEQDLSKEHVGSQDQTLAAFGGFNKVEFGANDHLLSVEKMTLGSEKLKLLQEHLMLFFTGFSRTASEVAKEQIKNIPKKKKELETMYQMVDEAIRILNSGNLNDFGTLLNETWQLKRRLSNRITTPYIDDMYETALRAGAKGGKLLGAGGGGFLLLFVEPEKQAKVRSELKALLQVPFQFENSGSQIIFYYQADSYSEKASD